MLKRKSRLILFLLIGSGTAASSFLRSNFCKSLAPSSVGLKVVNQYDPSRTFPATPDRPEAPARQGSRPLQTLIWYPALQSRSKPMTIGDYVALADREIHLDTPDQEHNKWRTRLKSSFDISLWAVRDAKPVEVRYPVIIYAPSDSSIAWENADLCEYLASHGYVVLASPSMGASTRDMTDDLAGIDTQALDISFLISYAARLPDTDSSKVAVVSFSWGGISEFVPLLRRTPAFRSWLRWTAACDIIQDLWQRLEIFIQSRPICHSYFLPQTI